MRNLREKKQIRDITINRDIQEIHSYGSYGSQLVSLENNAYTSDLFSNLHYEDLKSIYGISNSCHYRRL